MKEFVSEIFDFLNNLPEVKECKIYGSISTGNNDEFSDLDIAIDVSGIDNGVFLTKLPDIFSGKYDIIFYDYTQSLAPNKYIVSIAINEKILLW